MQAAGCIYKTFQKSQDNQNVIVAASSVDLHSTLLCIVLLVFLRLTYRYMYVQQVILTFTPSCYSFPCLKINPMVLCTESFEMLNANNVIM